MMKEGPDIAYIGSLIGDPARANMLTALLCGKALTASELAKEAGITPQTASSHLRQLQVGRSGGQPDFALCSRFRGVTLASQWAPVTFPESRRIGHV